MPQEKHCNAFDTQQWLKIWLEPVDKITKILALSSTKDKRNSKNLTLGDAFKICQG